MKPNSLYLIAMMAQLHLPSGRHSQYVERGYPCFGLVVGRAGDVDGDGVPDFIVGDPGDGPDHIAPTFWIVSGHGGATIGVFTMPESPSAGFRVDGGFDSDGDGIPDLLVSAQSYNSQQKGVVCLISGNTRAVLNRIDVRGSRSGRGNWAGFVGDVDHDGRSDYGVLSPKASEHQGTLFIYSGRSSAQIEQIQIENLHGADIGGFLKMDKIGSDKVEGFAVLIDGTEASHASLGMYSASGRTRLWEHLAPHAGGGAYCEIAALGDLDGDGTQELAVSFIDCIEVVSGRDGSIVHRLESLAKSDSERGFGYSLLSLGDTKKGWTDEFVASELEGNETLGIVRAIRARDGTEVWRATGSAKDEIYHFGTQLAAIGDVDGDGVGDLAVGSDECLAYRPGCARVLSGKDGSVILQVRRGANEVVCDHWRGTNDRPR